MGFPGIDRRLGIVLAVYFGLGFLFAWQTPPWQAPDEPAHANYVRHLAEGRGLPELKPGDWDAAYLDRLKASRFPPGSDISPIRYEFHQPPLYYALLTPVYLATNGSLLALRLTSLAIGALGIVGVYLVGRLVFPAEPGVALGAAGIAATLPQHVAVLASVNNDALAGAVAAGLLAWGLAGLAGKPSRSWAVAGGLLAGLALLTKTTVYPLVGLAVGLPLAAGHRTWGRGALGAAATVAGLALLVGGWWFGRNAAVYGGLDILGLGRHDQVVVGQPRTGPLSPGLAASWLLTAFRSFWLQLGWMGVPAEDWVYGLLAGVSAVAGLGLALTIPELVRSPAGRLMAGWLGLAAGLVAAQFVWYNLQFYQPQGRYLFPAMAVWAVALAAGFRRALAPELRAWWILPVLLAALSLWAVVRYIPFLR
jgi:4-amino-4-deoxy-L-arabinose transferase-like glycosyltransferase